MCSTQQKPNLQQDKSIQASSGIKYFAQKRLYLVLFFFNDAHGVNTLISSVSCVLQLTDKTTTSALWFTTYQISAKYVRALLDDQNRLF